MKLRKLLPNVDSDHEITHALPLDAAEVPKDAIRFTLQREGKCELPVGGLLLTGEDTHHTFHTHEDQLMLECRDPKASFIEALEKLYPAWEEVEFRCFLGNSLLIASALHDGRTPIGFKVGFNSTIGGVGFGYHKDIRFPHIGGVKLGHDVEVGSNTCIDRGTLGDTFINHRTKIDNNVHIAHNVRIGVMCQVVAGAVIGGSAVIGDRVFIGMGALIKNKVRIGDDAVIGMGAVVTKDVPAGETWVGNPARKLEK